MIDAADVEELTTAPTSQSFSQHNEPTLHYPYLFRRVFLCGHNDEMVKVDRQPGHTLRNCEVVPWVE